MTRRSTSARATASGAPLYQLKVTLLGARPPIWRQVVVPASIRLDRLHFVLQTVMGRTNSHMHQFITGTSRTRTYFGAASSDAGNDDGPALEDERAHALADLAPGPKQRFFYEYDFGDSWEHEIVVEKLLPPAPAARGAVCVAGAGACPPEDCGGLDGYYDLLEILADRKHPDHAEMKSWAGGLLDPAHFDLAAVNRGLSRCRV